MEYWKDLLVLSTVPYHTEYRFSELVRRHAGIRYIALDAVLITFPFPSVRLSYNQTSLEINCLGRSESDTRVVLFQTVHNNCARTIGGSVGVHFAIVVLLFGQPS